MQAEVLLMIKQVEKQRDNNKRLHKDLEKSRKLAIQNEAMMT